ncbi:hypothetical protein SLS62_005573 [Diatrype stigma]|uniref:KAR9-domain-containing protein n=1 Tax=Diatrype stigma TaxID=117547 RepID=A0AAN9YSN2_9PEZI
MTGTGQSGIAGSAAIASSPHQPHQPQTALHPSTTPSATTATTTASFAIPDQGSPDHQQNDDPPPTVLTFSGVPTDQLHLQAGPPNPQLQQPQPPQPPQPHIRAPSDQPDKPQSPPSASKIGQHRKPSPGLAARLKALGFLSNKESQSTRELSHAERIGRLPEDQLREIDQKHLANSNGLVVERRGRAWKGAGAPLQLLRSRSKRDLSQAYSDDGRTSSLASEPELLPEIQQNPPLDMDTNKYRLPDHTNGNGTKAQLSVRKEHLERGVRVPDPESPTATPPPPPPKDTPPAGTAPTEYTPDLPSYFNPLGLQRAGSIYTISRASFAEQLAQLTALQLPDAELLSSKVSAIPTAQAAVKALLGAAEQIRGWISKASEVISGLESEDDVEWAAAGGREGYTEVENAIARFEELINVYVSAIEDLQGRDDIAKVSNEDLQRAVMQMESIMKDWGNIRNTLNNAKVQVEIAMEWEELWDMVLGDIQNELDELSRLVFEMEERRHKSIMAVEKGEGVDIGDLETIIEETPPVVARNNRFSLPVFPVTPTSPGGPQLTQDDSSLLALFARMQPLRASLDFLPMRLSVFQARAEQTFPTACEELEMRRAGLEGSYKKLEKDAESVRKELGEDKWVLVFRGAGRQAQKMIESVDRSMAKLREGIDQRMQLTNPPAMSKKIESYEAKRIHYGPAIERVMSIIEKGVKDRLTVNGEILRLHTELQSRWKEVKTQMKDMEPALEEIQSEQKGQQLRDSISSMLSNDMSTIGSGRDTPGSSPPSSVVMSSLGLDPITPQSKSKTRSSSMGSGVPQTSSTRRSGSSLAPPSQISRRPLASRLSTLSNASNQSTPPRSGSATPLGASHATRLPRSASKPQDGRPRWQIATNTNNSDVGHNFRPLTLTTPSPYAKTPPPVRSTSSLNSHSKLPTRSPLSRATSESPIPQGTPSRKSHSRLGFRHQAPSPNPSSQPTQARSRLSMQSPMNALGGNRRASLQPPRPQDSIAGNQQRPVSSMAERRRVSLLPQPRTREESVGRQSPQAIAGARSAMRKAHSVTPDPQPKDSKPRWHF